MKFIIILSFYILMTHVSTSSVIIKWITEESLNEVVTLRRTFPPKSKFKCEWWKLVENKKIEEKGEDFFYGTTSKDCSLIIKDFDFNKNHLDIYKPIDTLNRDDEENDYVYVVAYFKSLELKKSKKSENIFEYSCEAKFLFPNTFDEKLSKGIEKALYETVTLDGKEVKDSNTENLVKDSLFKSYLKAVKGLFKIKSKKERRDIGSNEIILYTDKTDVFNNKVMDSIFECSINLLDVPNDRIEFSNSTRDILERVSTTTKNRRNSSNLIYLNYFTLFFIITFFLST